MASAALEARVGAFVLIGLLVVGGFLAVLSDWSLSATARVAVDYAYSGSLKAGAPVIMSGVRIGRVAALELVDDSAAVPVDELGRRDLPIVRAALDLDAAALPRLRRDARFYVGMQGLIGEAYVEVAPGSEAAGLDQTAAIRGVDAPKLHVMILRFSSTLATVSGLVGSADGDRLKRIGASVQSILAEVERVVDEEGGAIRKLVADLGATATALRNVVSSVDRALGDGAQLEALLGDGAAVSGELRRALPGLVLRAEEVSASVARMIARMEKDTDAKSVAEILANARDAAQRLSSITEDARILTQSLRRGEGTLGGLLRDPTVYEDVKELLRELKRNPWKLMWRE